MTPSQWRHGCAHALPRCAGNTAGVGSYVKRATTKAQASRPESRTRAIWPFQQKINCIFPTWARSSPLSSKKR